MQEDSKLHSPIQKIVQAATDNGLPVTLGGSISATVFWGLHISDLAVIVSALAAVIGVFLQFYVAMRRIHILEQDLAAARLVATAQAAAMRAGSVKSTSNASRITDLEDKLAP